MLFLKKGREKEPEKIKQKKGKKREKEKEKKSGKGKHVKKTNLWNIWFQKNIEKIIIKKL